jgi:hypothetical protein
MATIMIWREKVKFRLIITPRFGACSGAHVLRFESFHFAQVKNIDNGKGHLHLENLFNKISSVDRKA